MEAKIVYLCGNLSNRYSNKTNTNSRFFIAKKKRLYIRRYGAYVFGATQKRVNNILRSTRKGDVYYPRNRDNSVIQ